MASTTLSIRAARLVAAGALVGAAVLGTAGPALGASSKEKPTEVSKCVAEKSKSGQQASECVKSPNPIMPKGNELVWGSLSFLALLGLLAWKGYPQVKQGMDNRANRIRESLEQAEQAKDEAQSVLKEYQKQLSDAKGESARIIEEARQAADKLRQDLKQQAEAEVADIKTRAQEDISAQVDRAKADLQARVAELSIDLAEKVVERSLDRDTNRALIENFIQQVGATSN